MEAEASAQAGRLRDELAQFMSDLVLPAEARYALETGGAQPWQPSQLVEELKLEARGRGLWNLFLPDSPNGAGLSTAEYAPLCELMGGVTWSAEIFNCSAPDTGNMEILDRFGTPEQQRRWLQPLLDGEIRSGFAMTEPEVASSDATNIRGQIEREGDGYVITGRKWWTSGAMDPRCQLLIFMGKSAPENPDRHRQQSMLLVPRDAPGVKVVRPLTVFGYDDAPHGHAELDFDHVRVPAANLLLGEGRGFEIAQARLGPGRIHHCMRLVGLAERSLQLMCRRLNRRSTFGTPLARQSVWLERVARARILIDQARLLTLQAARAIDRVGPAGARQEIAMIKVAAPEMLCQVVDWSIQAHGAEGLSADLPLAAAYAYARSVRIADGPDEVHCNQIGKWELARHLE
ncbi:MAG: acyl-CoA dehydrogenase family protein [Candidatus Dormibacteria bacterium]